HLQGQPEPIHKLRPDVPAGLDAVVLHAMRRHPEHRYPSAQALREDLDRLDALDLSSYDLSPEAPIGGIAAIDSTKLLWAWAAMIGVGFVGIVTVIIVLSILLR
ncbi:MAG TPA: hypothetical protein VLL25_01920, partial [Acidimicrobiales bacterium]|nr:hypothetical protein [Acidimicrobiales bacterium]